MIEVMIVVAIIGILAAIALPSYSEHVRKGRRAEARAAIVEAAQWLERASTANATYPTALPASLASVESGTYSIGLVVAPDGYSYALTATPQNAQAGDQCGAYTLTQSGRRGLSFGGVPSADSSLIGKCWQ